MTGNAGRWVARSYPLLLALVPTLHYAAYHPAQYGPENLAFLVVLTLVFCGLVYAVATLAARGRAAPGLPAFATLLAVLWFFGYRKLATALPVDPSRPPHEILVPFALLVSIAALWWAWHRAGLLQALGRFLTVMAGLLVGWSGIQIVAGWLRSQSAIADSAVVSELARPIEGGAPASGVRRDIYLIVLDEYANSDVLRERFGYDNRPFEDSLRALGFHVPALVRSNYLHTLLSLPSLLNAAHLTGLGDDLGRESRHTALTGHLIDHNRVARYLRRQGYRYAFFPSHWWRGTSHSTDADLQFEPWQGFDLTRALAGGELERTVRGASVLSYVTRDHHWEAEHARRTFEAIEALADSGGPPIFAFAHILKPHAPYVFDRSCETLRGRRETDDRRPYIEQLECINRLLLATVRDILQASDAPPVILLQGDHGTSLLGGSTGYTRAAAMPPAAARERFGAFGAYYLPAGGAAAFGDTVTVVNVLGNVLRHYFGADLPRAGDEHYVSPAVTPYDFRRVDPRWLTGKEDSAGSAASAGG